MKYLILTFSIFILNQCNSTEPSDPGSFSCTNLKKTCSQMATCEEAHFYLEQCGVKELDADSDGVPCENKPCSPN